MADPRAGRVAFAKLQGEGFEYFVRKYEILLGRKSKSTELDIVLGDNMNISRQHAKISYNFDTGVFELSVMGKNGVTVNGVLHTPNSGPQQLYTQDFLQVGEQKFYFLLPRGISRRRPPSASPPAAKPEFASAPSADHSVLAQATLANSAPAAPTQAVSDQAMPHQTGLAEQQQQAQSQDAGSLMPNGSSQQHTQPEPVTSVIPNQSGNPAALLSSFHRPVIEIAQRPFLAPP